MATSKVNHNSGFITISIVILLAGVAIFSGQFIPDYFGGNVIGGPGGGGSFGGGGGTTLPIIADTLNPIYLSVSSIGQTSVSLAFQLPCNIGDNTQQNQQCEENAISNYQIRYGTQGEITDDNVFNTLPGPVYCPVGSNCLALDENTVIERTISGLQPNTQYWFVAQYTHKTKGDSPWSNSPPGKTLTNDADGDGIINTNDVCPNTPAGQQVDSTGCADSQIDADLDTYKKDVDCNDNNVNINPGVTEVCGDGIDNDCSGADLICNGDDDGDGIINANDLCSGTSAGASVNSNGCSDAQIDNDSDTYTEVAGDCNDGDAAIKPGATDVCGDGIDQDCAGGDLVCGTSGGSGGSGSGGGGGGGAGGSGTTSGGSQQTGTSKPADEPKLDTSKKYFDVTAPAKDKTDYFGLSIVTILGVVLVVFGYLRYFKPELAKKLFGSKTYENKSGTENSNSISNIFKNITNSFNKLFKKE